MTTIHCHYLKEEGTQLSSPPYPGIVGDVIHHAICQAAWSAWLTYQTQLINENRLNPLEKADRLTLEKAMIDFFDLQALIDARQTD